MCFRLWHLSLRIVTFSLWSSFCVVGWKGKALMLALYLVLHIMEEPTGSGQLRHVNPVRKIPGTPCWREIFSKGRILGSSFACPFCIDKKDRTTLSYRCQPLICVDAQRLRIRQKIEKFVTKSCEEELYAWSFQNFIWNLWVFICEQLLQKCCTGQTIDVFNVGLGTLLGYTN